MPNGACKSNCPNLLTHQLLGTWKERTEKKQQRLISLSFNHSHSVYCLWCIILLNGALSRFFPANPTMDGRRPAERRNDCWDDASDELICEFEGKIYFHPHLRPYICMYGRRSPLRYYLFCSVPLKSEL